MKYGYFPGCSLEGLSTAYDLSVRSLFEQLNVTFEDLPDWICCGTLVTSSVSSLLGLATPLWNIAQAKKAGYDRLVTPCSACLYHFKSAAKQVQEKPDILVDVETILGLPLSNSPPAIHPLELLSTDLFESRIKTLVKRDLFNLKLVSYYGCHISRPASVMQFDDPENPQSMDRLLGWAGVQVLDWSGKVNCCGAHISVVKPEIMVDLCAKLFENALEAGADAIVVACPMCHANLDTRQDLIGDQLGYSLDMPVLYFSQILGYAIGLEPERLGFNKHIINPLPLMLEKCQHQWEEFRTPFSSKEKAE